MQNTLNIMIIIYNYTFHTQKYYNVHDMIWSVRGRPSDAARARPVRYERDRTNERYIIMYIYISIYETSIFIYIHIPVFIFSFRSTL